MLIINVSLIRYVSRSQRKLAQLETYDEYKKLIIPLIENSRAIEHDFNNHLLTLKGLAENGNIKEFNEYYDAINSAVKGNSVYKQCNDPVLGALIQEKHDFAKKIILILISIYLRIAALYPTSVHII